MPIKNFPFSRTSPHDRDRLYLPVKIINPHNGKSTKAYGLVDSGADDCALPSYIAIAIGHDLKSVKPKIVSGVGGDVTAYTHTTSFEIYHPVTDKFAYKIDDTPVDYITTLNTVLLGVDSFLSKFVLKIDYPKS